MTRTGGRALFVAASSVAVAPVLTKDSRIGPESLPRISGPAQLIAFAFTSYGVPYRSVNDMKLR